MNCYISFRSFAPTEIARRRLYFDIQPIHYQIFKTPTRLAPFWKEHKKTTI
jgi:hypothetical protein